MDFNINAKAAVEFTNTLEKMSRSALPLAIRNTLNNTAFDVKQNTMPKSADDTFEKRQPNFFKANSRVEMAKGWNVRSMVAVVGFTETNLKGENNHAVEDLEAQEYGGTIKSRSFIPTDSARTGQSNTRPVRPGNRLTAIRNLVDSSKVDGANNGQKFLNAVAIAGPGGFVLGNKAKKIVWRIESINGRNIKMKPVYTYEENREVKVERTGFMQEASLESASKMELYFAKNAKKEIEKVRK